MSKGIDQGIIDRAKQLAAIRMDKETTFADASVNGLCIRVKGNRATWHLRSKPHKIDLGEIDAFNADQLDLVRELATKVKAHWKAGRSNAEIKVLIHSLVALPAKHETPMAAAEADLAVKIDGAWMWEVLRKEYLKWCSVHKSDATYNTYHSALGAAKDSVYFDDLKHLTGKAIANISQLDILMVRHNILERGGMVDGVPAGNIRTAEQVENALRAAFKYAIDPRRKSGLKVNPMIGLPGIEKPDVKKRDIVDADDIFQRTPMSLKQVHDFLMWVKRHPGFELEAKFATMLQPLTGQRIETVTSTFHNQPSRTYTSHRYQYVWYLGPDKSKRYRALPLPKMAAWVAHQAILRYKERAAAEDHANNFLFRQLRARRAGDAKNGHITNHMVNDIWRLAREEGGPLAGTEYSSHDGRKAFVTHMGKRGKQVGLPYDDCVKDLQAITHKGEGKATVIERHYDLDGDEQWRLRVLELWQNLILNAHGEKRRPDDDIWDLDEGEAFGLTQAEWRKMYPNQEEIEQEESERQERDGYELEQAGK